MTTVFNFDSSFLRDKSNIQQISVKLHEQTGGAKLLVFAAMGDTRSSLNLVAKNYFAGQQSDAISQFHQIKSEHLEIAKALLGDGFGLCLEQISDLFTEIEWLMHDRPVRHFEYYHDQIICLGELVDSCIISHYLRITGLQNTWMDARDLIRTDHQFMKATMDEAGTQKLILKSIATIIAANPSALIVTQSHIGATEDNESTSFEKDQDNNIADFFAGVLGAALVQNI